jgi:hypothetical protein
MRALSHEAQTRVVVTALVALHAGLLAWAAVRNSVAYDEYAHLPAGVAYWKHGELSIYNQSPPLLRWWGALPAVLAGAKAPDPAPVMQHPLLVRYWAYGELFLRENFGRYHHYFVLGRLGMIPISCLGAWIAYRFARELHGGNALAGIAACATYALCPNILAQASLVGTDAGSMVSMLAATWLWWRFCREPKVSRGTLAAVAIALAHLCKFYAVLLWPMMLLIAAWYAFAAPRVDRKQKSARFAAAFVASGLFTLFVINAAYGFRGSLRTLGSYAFDGTTFRTAARILPQRTPIPLPANFVEGYDAAQAEVQSLFPGYLLGETYRGSRWNYYPVALACKLPLATIVLLLAAIGSVARMKPTRSELTILLALLTFVAGFVLLADINIGVRYLLPAFPLAFVLAARLWNRVGFRRAGWALLGVLLVENLLAAPRYISFYNAAAGRGYTVVNDFDWGQSLIDLRDWMRDNDVPQVALAYNGRVDPAVYGIDYVPLVQQPDLPYVAISGYYLTGNGRPMRTSAGMSQFVAFPFAPQLLERKPAATLGSIMVYERNDIAEAQRRWQMAPRR